MIRILISIFIVVGFLACGGGGSGDDTSASVASEIDEYPLVGDGTVAFADIKLPIVPAGEVRTYQAVLNNANSSTKYSLKNAPSWLSINSTGVLSFNASSNSSETYSFSVLANFNGQEYESAEINGFVKTINANLAEDRSNAFVTVAYDTKAGVEDVRTGNVYMVPNDMNDKNSSWDIIQTYYQDYKKNIEIVVIDGDTGVIKKEYADGAAWNGMHNVIAPNGKLYMISGKANGTIKPQINIYDPKTNILKKDAIALPDDIYGNTYNGIQIATDGAMFIYARQISSGDDNYKPRIFEIDYENEVVKSDSGPIAKAAGIWKVCADDKYVYLLTGKVPWGVLQYERASPHTVKVIPTTNRANIMQTAYGVVIENYKVHGDKGFLYEDSIVPANDPRDWRKSVQPWPFPSAYSDWIKWYSLVIRTNIVDRFLPNKPEIIRSNVVPVHGEAELWIKQPKEGALKKYLYNLSTYPTTLNRLVKRSDGKVFAGSSGYGSYLTYDPLSDTYERSAGPLGVSLYTMIEHKNKIYMSGYPRGVLYEYDYTKPWTQGIHDYVPGAEPRPLHDQSLNPRWCGQLGNHGSGAHKIYTSAKGSDGLLYFGGQWMRDGNQGGLAWYNPENDEMGGISEPFKNYAIQHLTPINNGRYLAIATVAVTSNNGFKPDTAKVFIFDTASKKVIKTLDPVKGITGSIPGQIVGVSQDYIVGLTNDPSKGGRTRIYRMNINSGKLDYMIKVDRAVFEHNFAVGNTIALNENGKIITWLGWKVIELDPLSGDIKIVAQYDHGTRKGVQGDTVIVDNDVYISRFGTLLKLENANN